MTPTMSFTLAGGPGIRITVRETGDGRLQITASVLPGPLVADLRGLFFQTGNESLLGGLSVTDSTSTVSAFRQNANAVSNLGAGVNTFGAARPADVGIAFGTAATTGGDDIRSVTFTLAHATEALSLDFLSQMQFTAVMTSVGTATGPRLGTVRATGTVPANLAPVAVNDTAAVSEGATVAIAVLANDRDPNSDTIGIQTFTQPAKGIVTQLGASLMFDAATAFEALGAGETEVQSFTYTVQDGRGGTATATVTVTITGTNDGPTARDQAAAVAEDSATTTATGRLLAGATDPDATDTLTVTAVNGAAATLVDGTYGSLAWSATGGFTYTLDNARAATNALGEGQIVTESFSFTVSDGKGGSDTRTLTVTVTGNNDAPVQSGTPGTITVNEDAFVVLTDSDLALLAGVTDPDGPFVALDVVDVTGGPFIGVTQFAQLVAFAARPADWNSTLLGPGDTPPSVAVTFSDGIDRITVVLPVIVQAVNDAPVGVADTAATTAGAPVVIDVLANDTDVDGDALRIAGVTAPANGTLSSVGATITYTPNAGFVGTDSFTYRPFDGLAQGAPVTVTVTVTPGETVIRGTAGDDVIAPAAQGGSSPGVSADPTAARERIEALGGNDLIVASGGPDITDGGEGDDTFVFASQADFTEPGRILAGGAGTDTLLFRSGVTVVDADFAGVSGMEAIRAVTSGPLGLTFGSEAARAFADGITIDLTGAPVRRLTVDGTALTAATPLTVLATADQDSLWGGAGDDFFFGGGGADIMDGGAGDDDLRLILDPAGSARDHVRGGPGFDELTLELTSAQLADAAVRDELIRLQGVLGSLPPGAEGPAFLSDTLQLDMEGVEAGFVLVDGFRFLTLAQATAPVYRLRLVENAMPEGTGAGNGGRIVFAVERTAALGLDAASVFLDVVGSGANPVDLADLNGLGSFEVVFAAGETIASFVLVAQPDALREADEQLTVTLTGASLGTVDATPVTAVVVNDDRAADLSLTLARFGAAGPVKVGETTFFEVTVANDGPDSGGGTVQLTLPLDVTLNSVGLVGLGPPVVFDFTTATWTLPTLGAGESATLAIEVLAGAGAVGASNTIVAEIATATVTDPDSTPGNFNTSPAVEDDAASAGFAVIPLVADLRLALARTDGVGELPPEGIATFRLSVTNDGPDRGDGTARLALFGNAAIVSVASEGGAPPPAFLVDTATGDGLWDFSALAPGATDSVLVTLDFDGVGDFFVASEILTATVGDPDSTPGNGATNGEDDDASLFVTVREVTADLSVSTPNLSIGGTQGGIGTVTFDVTNNGPDAGGGSFGLAFNVFPVLDAVASGGSVDANDVWTLPVLAPGQSASITYTLRFDQAGNGNIVGEILSDTALDPDSTPGNFNTSPDPEDDTATANYAIVPGADLSLTASVTDTTVLFGEERAILFTVSNAGGAPGGGTVRIDDGSGGPDFIWTLPLIQPGEQAFLNLGVVFGEVGPRTVTAEIATATQPDPDSTPGNFATAPIEDDAASVTFTMPTSWRVTRVADIAEGSNPAIGQAGIAFRIERFGTDLPETTITFTQRPGSGPNPVGPGDVVGLNQPITYTFAAGQTLLNVAVNPVGDQMPEPNETIRLTLDSVGAGIIAPGFGAAEALVLDDDAPAGQLFYFSGLSPGRGRELWAFAPSEGGPPGSDPVARPVTAAEAVPAPGSTDPRDITALGGTVFWRGEGGVFGGAWYAYDPGSGLGLQELVPLAPFAFDADPLSGERTLAVRSGDSVFVAAEVSGEILQAFDEEGSSVGSSDLLGFARSQLTDAGGNPAYAALLDTFFPDAGTSGDAEQLVVVLPDPFSFGGWRSIQATDGGSPNDLNDIREIAGLRIASVSVNDGDQEFAKTLYFTGDFVDSSGTFREDALFTVTVTQFNDFGWNDRVSPEWLDNGSSGTVASEAHGLLVAETPVDIDPSREGIDVQVRERLFWFQKDAAGLGQIATRYDDHFGAFAYSTGESLGTGFEGFEIMPWEDGVIFSGARTADGSPFVATWTDTDGDGFFSLDILSDGPFDELALPWPTGGIVEHLVVDGEGRAAWVTDEGSVDTLWVFDGTEIYYVIQRFGEIDELQLADGTLVYRQQAFSGPFPTLFSHDIATRTGIEVPTDEPLGAGTQDGVVGGATLVATGFGIAFQASSANQFGTRLWTAAEGALEGALNLLTVAQTAEGNLGTGIAFDGAWIGTGFRHDTAEIGLFRADADGLATLHTDSTDFGAAVAALGDKVLFGTTARFGGDRVLLHDLAADTTSVLLTNHVIGSAGTVGQRIIFTARDDSRAVNSDTDLANDVWTLFAYSAPTGVAALTDLPRGTSGPVRDDPVVPWSVEAVSFLGDDSRVFWKQRNDATAGDIGVELHSFDFATSTLTILDVGAGAISGSDFNEAVFANGRLYFQGSSDGSFGQLRVQVTDGTNLLTPVTGPELRAPFGSPNNLIALDGEVFFTAIDDATGFQRVFQLDDNGATATRLALPGIAGVPFDLAALGSDIGVLAFQGGAAQLFRFTPGAQPGGESAATQLTSFATFGDMSDLTLGGDGEVYFARTEPATGRELWVVDGTAPSGARLVQDINREPEPAGYFPEQVTAVPNPLEFLFA